MKENERKWMKFKIFKTNKTHINKNVNKILSIKLQNLYLIFEKTIESVKIK
jgi:hypothetical protein